MIHKASCSSEPVEQVKLETINYSDGQLVAETYWLAMMVNRNYSLFSVDHFGGTFPKTFLGSKISEIFSLSRTSASYMISKGLAPYFKKTIVEDLVKSNLLKVTR